jgi:putative endonuclease
MATRKQLGDFGEQVAATHLERAGLVIVARKWRCRLGEIDLVAHDGEELVFVEVRTRREDAFGLAAESVGKAKRARLAALAQSYLATAGIPTGASWRIDVVAVNVSRSGQVTHVEHIPAAVEQ